jgi:penicillin amidase
VIHGDHTANGKPILVSDPHLAKSKASQFYLSRISYNNKEVVNGVTETYRTYFAGGFLVGYPILAYGRNPLLAWGATSISCPNQDIFVDKVDLQSGKYYDPIDDSWKKLDTHTEIIKVRG